LVQAFPRIQRRYYFAIFILAAAALSYQILITRFFSVMLYYHFAFAAISLAMFGLTLLTYERRSPRLATALGAVSGLAILSNTRLLLLPLMSQSRYRRRRS